VIDVKQTYHLLPRRRRYFLLLPLILFAAAIAVVAIARRNNSPGPLFEARTAAQVNAALARGEPVNDRDRVGRTPLHFAAARCRPEAVAALLQAGGDVNARTPSGEAPLSLAAQDLIDPDEGYGVGSITPRSRLEAVRLLLQAGADPNAKETSGRTPVFHATRDPLLLSVLLNSGADATAVDADGFSPLHEAAAAGNAEVVRMLIEHGAQVNASDRWEHRTPLKMATDEDVRQQLIDAGGK
jgi:hypothetical protein